ncbi:hypothetical protein CVT26_001599 [Gymnopilus dilepis]|uniref:C2H2-type domain-containing protein n=1 Tax=Gymnopilus dilepis TaxID=231916 RepID=A0A409YXE9_9AGAR|nr:hypothetical protein CVT26_001599 [Gymnopilus dilepis]
MDIGILFDVENLDGTISPASYSNREISTILSNSSPISRSHSSPRNVRTRMRSIPSFSHNHDSPLWPQEDSPMSMRSWEPMEDQHRYTPPLQRSRPTNQNTPGPSTTTALQYSSSPSFPSNGYTSSRFSQPSRTLVNNAASSPSREDIAWQMYISSSVSLEFCEAQSVAPHSVGESMRPLPDSLSPPRATVQTSGSSNCPPTTINPALFLQIAPQPSSHLPPAQPSPARRREDLAPSRTNGPVNQYPGVPAIRSDGTYAVPVAQPMVLQPSLLVSSASAMSHQSSPARNLPLPIAQPKPTPARPGQGISGWSGTDHLRVPSPTVRPKRRRSSASLSPAPYVKRATKASSTAPSVATTSARAFKRSRRSASTLLDRPAEFDCEDEDDFEDSVDSDEYHPSRSASPDLSYQHTGFSDDGGSKTVPFPRKKMRRVSKGKAKGSAALALALVTQMGGQSRSGSELPEEIGVDINDALALYQEGRIGIRKRKNQPIPLPVPVPNLNKKSRGRKVPYVANVSGSASPSISISSGSSGVKEEYGTGSASDARAPSLSLSTTGRGSRRRTTASNRSSSVPDDGSGPRSFVCVVPGCGKCFVRGEHLKRHVRSIHTNDKRQSFFVQLTIFERRLTYFLAHQCPYEGCDKSFSRRDNLGQHVRIHLQP